jgi:hypothetical protein
MTTYIEGSPHMNQQPQKNFNDKAGKRISDETLLDLVQSQTLKYFTDFAHPVSGMARERSNVVLEYGYDLDCVTSGGTGFGIMALIAGAERGWIAPNDVLARITKIVDFLEGAEKYHGAFPHFINGNTGKTIPFLPVPVNPASKDNGGDLVETSYLMMGLLCARQYLSTKPEAADVCGKINNLWEKVEWDWYTQGSSDKLYWHWSPQYNWEMNLPITGWNECLITHLLANASPTHPVSPQIYAQSWAKGSEFKNGEAYAGIFIDGVPQDTIRLPLGPTLGGPLFFSHYSFLGLNPAELKDQYADYWEQNRNHALLNRAHCINNPQHYKGYGADCWGLTASDDHQGYSAHSPTNDNGAISPTAALSSFPYTPEYSMQALRHFYEDLGDKIWGDYGFVDAFNESENWYAKSHLAIDQGPIVVMIENYRSGLLWNLFMSCPEVKQALDKLDFESPKTVKPQTPFPKPPCP